MIYGKYKAGIIQPWVVNQADVWVDKNGTEYTLDEMGINYVENVINFLERNAYKWSDAVGRPYEPYHKSVEWMRETVLYQRLQVELFMREIHTGVYDVD
jgi:hypothetical protein